MLQTLVLQLEVIEFLFLGLDQGRVIETVDWHFVDVQFSGHFFVEKVFGLLIRLVELLLALLADALLLVAQLLLCVLLVEERTVVQRLYLDLLGKSATGRVAEAVVVPISLQLPVEIIFIPEDVQHVVVEVNLGFGNFFLAWGCYNRFLLDTASVLPGHHGCAIFFLGDFAEALET